jgi:hypothetical protein
MDGRRQYSGGRDGGAELNELLRRAVSQARTAPAPMDAIARVLEQSLRIGSSLPLWRRWLLRGDVGSN